MPEKITMSIKVHMTESEFNGLSRVCATADRSASEYIRVHLLRPHLFDILPRTPDHGEWANSVPAPLSGPLD